ncbi:unnamed protein product, partial [Effrenium voratum]
RHLNGRCHSRGAALWRHQRRGGCKVGAARCCAHPQAQSLSAGLGGPSRGLQRCCLHQHQAQQGGIQRRETAEDRCGHGADAPHLAATSSGEAGRSHAEKRSRAERTGSGRAGFENPGVPHSDADRLSQALQ